MQTSTNITIHPDKSWSLFLDRDGVINIEKKDDYINRWDEFVLYDGTVQAVADLSNIFGYVFIATNQKGIGKGLTKEADVLDIHERLQKMVMEAGGRIDTCYFCPDLSDDSPCRKPNPGMAFQAKQDFPDIDLNKSLMVGNNLSDMHFGRNAGMKTAFVRTTHPDIILPEGLADFDLPDFPALKHLLKNPA